MSRLTRKVIEIDAMLTIRETADVLGLSERTVFRMMRAGELEVVRIGRRTWIPATALKKYGRVVEREADDV